MKIGTPGNSYLFINHISDKDLPQADYAVKKNFPMEKNPLRAILLPHEKDK